MDNERPGFSDDLESIQDEVEADVGTILELAKRQNETDPKRSLLIEKSNTPAKRPVRPEHPTRTKSRPLVAAEPQPQLLQNVTTRLSLETNALLTEAALRQKLSKSTPATRQDIIEAATREWLRQHGYHVSLP